MKITRCVPEMCNLSNTVFYEATGLNLISLSLTSAESPPLRVFCNLEQPIVSDSTDEILQSSYFTHY